MRLYMIRIKPAELCFLHITISRNHGDNISTDLNLRREAFGSMEKCLYNFKIKFHSGCLNAKTQQVYLITVRLYFLLIKYDKL